MSAVPSLASRPLAALPVLRSPRLREIGRQTGIGLLTLLVISLVTFGMMSVRSADQIARGSVREALGASYTQAAVLRGLSRRTVIWDHVMRNAGIPLVNAVAVNIVYLLSGVIVVETVFAFPGIGAGLVQATSTSDAFNVQAIALLMGAMFIIVSLLADVAVAYLNPRLKAATR